MKANLGLIMRKDLLVLGVILLFVGIVAVSTAANIEEEKIVLRETVGRKTASELINMTDWSVSGNYSKGRRLRLVIQPGNDWMAEPAQGYHYIIVNVTICDPEGDKTQLRVEFRKDAMAVHNLELFSVEIISSCGGLTFEKSNELTINGTTYYWEISGVANYDGVYNATVGKSWGTFGPPEILKLESLVVERSNPYWLVIPVGVGFMVAGLFLLVWVWKSSKHKKRAKTSIH